MSNYRVSATIGGVDLPMVDDGAAAGYGLADPLTITDSLPDSDVAPICQRDPSTAQLSVIAPDSTTYKWSIGDTVRCSYYSQNALAGTPFTFFGRIAQLSSRPHRLGVMHQVSAVDYLADLAEFTVGTVAYAQEPSSTRVMRYFDEAGIPRPTVVGGVIGTPPDVVARAASPGKLSDLVEEALAGWFAAQTTDELGNAMVAVNCRYELQPNITNPGGVPGFGGLDATTPWLLVPVLRPVGWSAPARFGITIPFRKLTVDPANTSPATGSFILDGGHVDSDSTFTQRKAYASTRFSVSTPAAGTAVASWGSMVNGSTVETAISTQLANLADAQTAAAAYQGVIQPDQSNLWLPGDLTWRDSRTEPNNHIHPRLRQLVTIGRVDSPHNPTGKLWVTGLVGRRTLTVADGEATVTLGLVPLETLPTRVATMAHYDSASLATLTFAQLDSTDTFTDYMLLHS